MYAYTCMYTYAYIYIFNVIFSNIQMTFSRDRWHNKATATCNIKSLLEDSTMRRRPHLERPQWMESAYALKLSNKASTALSEECLSKESKGSRCETMELQAQDLSKGKSCIVEIVACHTLPKNKKHLNPCHLFALPSGKVSVFSACTDPSLSIKLSSYSSSPIHSL